MSIHEIVKPDLLLFDGVIICLIVGVVVAAIFFWKPRVWLNDLPSDIRALAQPMTQSEKRWLKLFGLLIVSLLLVGIVISTLRFGFESGFLLAALHAYLLFQIFNLFDFAVLDVGIMLMIDPAEPPIEGTQNAEGYRDFSFHFFKSVKGIALGVPFALIGAGIAWLITTASAFNV